MNVINFDWRVEWRLDAGEQTEWTCWSDLHSDPRSLTLENQKGNRNQDSYMKERNSNREEWASSEVASTRTLQVQLVAHAFERERDGHRDSMNGCKQVVAHYTTTLEVYFYYRENMITYIHKLFKAILGHRHTRELITLMENLKINRLGRYESEGVLWYENAAGADFKLYVKYYLVWSEVLNMIKFTSARCKSMKWVSEMMERKQQFKREVLQRWSLERARRASSHMVCWGVKVEEQRAGRVMMQTV